MVFYFNKSNKICLFICCCCSVGRKVQVEKTSLIKHTTNQQQKKQDAQRIQTLEAHSTSHT